MSHGKTKDFLVSCARHNCAGSIWASVLAHKHTQGILPTCRVCEALPRGGQKRKFLLPPGAEKDPVMYQRANKQWGNRSNTVAPRTDKPPSKWNSEGKLLSRIKDLEGQLKGAKAQVNEEEAPTEQDDPVALRAAIQSIKVLGSTPPPDLVKRLAKFEQHNTGGSDLKSILGKLKAAQNHQSQIASNIDGLEEKLETAKKAMYDATKRVLELEKARDEANRTIGFFKVGDVPEGASVLPEKPEGISGQREKEWDDLLAQQAAFLEAFKKQHSQLFEKAKVLQQQTQGEEPATPLSTGLLPREPAAPAKQGENVLPPATNVDATDKEMGEDASQKDTDAKACDKRLREQEEALVQQAMAESLRSAKSARTNGGASGSSASGGGNAQQIAEPTGGAQEVKSMED